MRIAVTSNGADLSAPASPVFGRCPMLAFVDTETMAFEARENPALEAPGGAGIRAAEYIAEQGAEALVTGNVGPNAFQVLEAAGIPVYLHQGGSVRQVVEAFIDGKLERAGAATAAEHGGMERPSREISNQSAPAALGNGPRAEEIAALKAQVRELREQLAGLTNRLDEQETKE